jgi:PAS domain S-box-containing protein
MGPLNRTELVAHFLQEEASHEVEALKSENQRLLSELSEHSKTEELLRASLELFRGLIETAPDAIVVVNENGIVQLANDQAARMFGYAQSELLGLRVDALIPQRYRMRHLEHRASYMENPTKRRMGEHLATSALRRDGTEFPMATALSATKTPSGILVTCIVRDLSERMAERALARVGAEEEPLD